MAVCVERKRYLSGREVTFACELVALERGFGILKYVLDREWQVQDLALRPGDVTYAFYWEDRPYNVYWWLRENGDSLGHYFNLADSVKLSAEEFEWRDLIVDILVTPAGMVHVIDEAEIPEALGEELRAAIEVAKRRVLGEYLDVVKEVEQKLSFALPAQGE